MTKIIVISKNFFVENKIIFINFGMKYKEMPHFVNDDKIPKIIKCLLNK